MLEMFGVSTTRPKSAIEEQECDDELYPAEERERRFDLGEWEHCGDRASSQGSLLYHTLFPIGDSGGRRSYRA